MSLCGLISSGGVRSCGPLEPPEQKRAPARHLFELCRQDVRRRAVELGADGSRCAVLRLMEPGFVTPPEDADSTWKFSFQDLALLSSAQELRSARIPTRQILEALRQLKASVPKEMPLDGLRILAAGDRVTVGLPMRTGNQRSVGSGSTAHRGGGTVATLPVQQQNRAPSMEVELAERFARAEALDEHDPVAAEALAVQLYADGVRFCPGDPLIHFNRAMALEGIGNVEPARASCYNGTPAGVSTPRTRR